MRGEKVESGIIATRVGTRPHKKTTVYSIARQVAGKIVWTDCSKQDYKRASVALERENKNVLGAGLDASTEAQLLEGSNIGEAQHSPLPDEAEITRQAGLQAARAHKWNGWDWKAYQTSITRQNHHISKIEAHADKLAEALQSFVDACPQAVMTQPLQGARASAIKTLKDWNGAKISGGYERQGNAY